MFCIKTELKRYNFSYVHYVFICQLILKVKFWHLASYSRFLSTKMRISFVVFSGKRERRIVTMIYIPLSNIAGGSYTLL